MASDGQSSRGHVPDVGEEGGGGLVHGHHCVVEGGDPGEGAVLGGHSRPFPGAALHLR